MEVDCLLHEDEVWRVKMVDVGWVVVSCELGVEGLQFAQGLFYNGFSIGLGQLGAGGSAGGRARGLFMHYLLL